MATVISHELAHVELGHSDADIVNAGRSGEPRIGSDSAQEREFEEWRRQELEADRVGVGYMVRAGWTMQDAMDLYAAMSEHEAMWARWAPPIPTLRAIDRLVVLESQRTGVPVIPRDLAACEGLVVTGEIRLGTSGADVVRALGPPDRHGWMGGWEYRRRGLTLTVDSTLGVQSISISVADAATAWCVRVGDTVESVLRKLGTPARRDVGLHGETLLTFLKPGSRTWLMARGGRIILMVVSAD